MRATMGVLAQLTAWEAGNLWRISWASILITLFSFTLSLITPMFVGHLGELEPAGTSISNIDIQGLPYGVMVCHCTCFLCSPVLFHLLKHNVLLQHLLLACTMCAMQIGMVSAVQTICGQA